MAPRRLVLAMLLLLAFSTVIALMAPDPSERNQQETERQTEAGVDSTQSDPGSENEDRTGSETRPDDGDTRDEKASVSKSQKVDEDGGAGPIDRTVNAGSPTEVIRVRSGQRVVLEIRSSETIEISIPELGRIATADRWAPAVFDLVIPAGTESFEVVSLSSGRPIARLIAD